MTIKLQSLFIASLFTVCEGISLASPVTLHVDNTHSSIQFSVPFLAISEVSGRFERFCGMFYFDETNISRSRVELFIDASSINTGLKIRDRDLIEQYLETKSFPIIYYTSKSIRSNKAGRYDIVGDLTLHGVTKELQITLVTIGDIVNSEKAREIGLKLQPVTLNRTDYGIMKGSMGGGSVGDTITGSAMIRLRDITPYTRDLDLRYPEKNIQTTVLFSGNFISKAGARIDLTTDSGNYFISFNDGEWSWFAQAKIVGINAFKLLSFSSILEVSMTELTYTALNEPMVVFTRVVKE